MSASYAEAIGLRVVPEVEHVPPPMCRPLGLVLRGVRVVVVASRLHPGDTGALRHGAVEVGVMRVDVCQRYVRRCTRFVAPSPFDARRYEGVVIDAADEAGWDTSEARGWHVVAWKARGGYASQGDDANVNATRERLWFSPHCLRPETDRQRSIFEVIS